MLHGVVHAGRDILEQSEVQSPPLYRVSFAHQQDDIPTLPYSASPRFRSSEFWMCLAESVLLDALAEILLHARARRHSLVVLLRRLVDDIVYSAHLLPPTVPLLPPDGGASRIMLEEYCTAEIRESGGESVDYIR